MWHERMTRYGATCALLAAVASDVTGCASNHDPASETETLPPAPANATASCVFQLVSTDLIARDSDLPTSTLWLDASGQVIRVDGWRFAGTSPYGEIPTAYDLTWDSEGRLVRLHGKDDDVQLTYSTDQVVEMRSGGATVTHHLENGRDVRDQESPAPGRNLSDFTLQAYDAAGRLSAQTSGTTDLVGMVDVIRGRTEFRYDAKGRITGFLSDSFPPTGSYSNLGFYYIETDNRLVVDVVDLRDSLPTLVQTWTFEFDSNHRLVRDTVDDNGDGYDDFWDEFRYLDGEIDIGTHAPSFESTMRATGSCETPSVILAPVPSLPFQLRRIAQYRSLPNEVAAALSALGAAGALIPYPAP